jgi:hypothetical protein
LAKWATLPDATVQADYAHFRAFYFDHNEDAARDARFRQRLGMR